MIVYGQNTFNTCIFAMNFVKKRHARYDFMECNMYVNLDTKIR